MEIKAFVHSVHGLAKEDDKKTTPPMGESVSEMAHEKKAEKLTPQQIAKKQMNAAILQSASEVSLNSGNESLSLVLKTAIENINEALKEATGEDNAIQNAYESGLDISPEATAERIVSLSTAFFTQYQEVHPAMDSEEALSSFVEIIRGGIEKGFKEARDILEGLQVLENEVAENIDKTYELVQQGLKDFIESYNSVENTDEQ
jgi:proline dehydrogenase